MNVLNGGRPHTRRVTVTDVPTLLVAARTGAPYRSGFVVQMDSTSPIRIGGSNVAFDGSAEDPVGVLLVGNLADPATSQPAAYANATSCAAYYGIADTDDEATVIVEEQIES